MNGRWLAVVVGAGILAGPGCSRGDGGVLQHRSVTFRGDVVATVDERVEGERIQRVVGFDGDVIEVDATLDAQGFVTRASSVRRRAREVVRAVKLVDGLIIEANVADDAPRLPRGATPPAGAVRLGADPVVLLEFVHRLRVTHAVAAQLVDLGTGEVLAVHVERRGPEIAVVDGAGHVVVRALPEGNRVGPGAFAEGDAPPALPTPPVEIPVPGTTSLRGSTLPRAARLVAPPAAATPTREALARYRAPGLFLQSEAAPIRAFVAPLCGGTRAGATPTTPTAPTTTTTTTGTSTGTAGDDRALEDARRIAEAVRPRVDAANTREPPSALRMLVAGGDCDGAAALVVAALRACGHAARPVTGYRLVDAGGTRARLVPHAVAEVYTATGWVKVDATMPALGTLEDTFLPVAEGLGGALSLGRVLGVVDGGDVVAGDRGPVVGGPNGFAGGAR